MNNAKKIMKNQGLKNDKRPVHAESNVLQKNKVLLIIGLMVMAALVAVVCYINLQCMIFIIQRCSIIAWRSSISSFMVPHSGRLKM